MIRKLLSNRVLFTAGIVLLVLSAFVPKWGGIFDAGDLAPTLAVLGAGLTAYSLWGLVASLRPATASSGRGQGLTGQTPPRSA